MAVAISLSALTEPSPGVGISVAGLSAVAQSTITIWREVDDISDPVRGAFVYPVNGAMYVEDFEADLGRDISYRAEVLTGPDAGTNVSASIRLESATGWLSDPLNPELSVPVTCGYNHSGAPGFDQYAYPRLMADGLNSVSLSMSSELLTPIGADRPVVFSGVRQRPSDWNLVLETRIREHAEQIMQLLRFAAPVILYRGLSCTHLMIEPRTYFFSGNATKSLIPGLRNKEWLTWNFSGVSVAPPAFGVIQPLWTYNDLLTTYASYDEVLANNQRYFEVMRGTV